MREYTRSDAGDYITYPRDVLLSNFDKLFSFLWIITFPLLIVFITYTFYLGAASFYKKYSEKLFINRIIFIIFSFLLYCFSFYALATTQFGASFILEPFYGTKIYYGGYDNIKNSLNYQINKTNNPEKIQKLEKRKKQILSQEKDEEIFTEDEQEKRLMSN
ncbi:MAG: hypothetical protein ABID45_04915 [Patescibacteria group bacterium]